jgi:hypothetical protein
MRTYMCQIVTELAGIVKQRRPGKNTIDAQYARPAALRPESGGTGRKAVSERRSISDQPRQNAAIACRRTASTCIRCASSSGRAMLDVAAQLLQRLNLGTAPRQRRLLRGGRERASESGQALSSHGIVVSFRISRHRSLPEAITLIHVFIGYRFPMRSFAVHISLEDLTCCQDRHCDATTHP